MSGMWAGRSARVCRTASITKWSASALFQLDHAVDIGRLAHRVVNHRPFALRELEVHAHRLEDRQQIGEHDRRVDAQPLDGRAHDLAAQLRIAAQLEKTRAARGSRRYSGM